MRYLNVLYKLCIHCRHHRLVRLLLQQRQFQLHLKLLLQLRHCEWLIFTGLFYLFREISISIILICIMCYLKASLQFDRPATVTAPESSPSPAPAPPASISPGTPVYVFCFLPWHVWNVEFKVAVIFVSSKTELFNLLDSFFRFCY